MEIVISTILFQFFFENESNRNISQLHTADFKIRIHWGSIFFLISKTPDINSASNDASFDTKNVAAIPYTSGKGDLKNFSFSAMPYLELYVYHKRCRTFIPRPISQMYISSRTIHTPYNTYIHHTHHTISVSQILI